MINSWLLRGNCSWPWRACRSDFALTLEFSSWASSLCLHTRNLFLSALTCLSGVPVMWAIMGFLRHLGRELSSMLKASFLLQSQKLPEQSPDPEACTGRELRVYCGTLHNVLLSYLKAEQVCGILLSLTEAHLFRLSSIIFICFLNACFLINSGCFWKYPSVFTWLKLTVALEIGAGMPVFGGAASPAPCTCWESSWLEFTAMKITWLRVGFFWSCSKGQMMTQFRRYCLGFFRLLLGEF